jgi:alpha-N-arabinofuranosidase
VNLVQEGIKIMLQFNAGPELKQAKTKLTGTAMLGKAKVPGLPYENPDGSSLKIDTDYLGKKRNEASPTSGPFEKPGTGSITLTR